MYGNAAAAGTSLPATGAFVTGQVGIGLATLAFGLLAFSVPKLLRRTKAEHMP